MSNTARDGNPPIVVDYVGGPAEGRVETLLLHELTPRREVAVVTAHHEPIWEDAVAPKFPLFRRAMYVLHRYGERYEYVHSRTYDL